MGTVGEKVSATAWKQHRINVRAKELLEEHPPQKMVPFHVMRQNVDNAQRRRRRRRHR